MCAHACVTFCASMHTHAFKGKHFLFCKYAQQVCSLSQIHTNTHKSTQINTHTYLPTLAHTQFDTGCPFPECSDLAERRTNTLMDSLCLKKASAFLSSSLFPFPLFLFFSFAQSCRPLHRGLCFPESTHTSCMLPHGQINAH